MKLHVSSLLGSDANDGSETRPLRTAAEGYSRLPDREPSELLFRRGDAWDESLGHWKKSGRAWDEPIVIGSYGQDRARPLFRTGTFDGFYTGPGGGSPPNVDNITLRGLHFFADDYTGANECYGVRLLQPCSGFLIDDCMVEGYGQNLSFQAFSHDGDALHESIVVHRSIIVDAFSLPGGMHSQGLYADAVQGLVVEGCLFDHNGNPDIFSHNIYIDNRCTEVKVRRNIIARAGSHGAQVRSGGDVTTNLFIENPIALLVGGGNTPRREGVEADVVGNVILYGKDIDAANPRGWGMTFANIKRAKVAVNVIAHGRGKQPSILTLEADPDVNGVAAGIGCHNMRIQHNVAYDWAGEVSSQGRSDMLTGNVWTPNQWNGLHEYLDPERIPPTALLAKARHRAPGEWRPDLTAPVICRDIRDGFRSP